MFCPKCGNLLNDNEKYCRSCGAKVERSESKVNAPCDHSHGTTELPPVTLGEAVRLFFTRYVDFEGRSRRSEFWGAQLALSIRRLHDIGKSWVYYLWNLLPVAGQIILLYYFCKDSEPHANAWGESPKYPG